MKFLAISLPRHLSPWTEKAPAIDGQGTAAPPSRVIPVSLLTEHDSFIHFDERPLGHRLRQSVPLQYPIIDPHQHFELCERCLPKSVGLALPCRAVSVKSCTAFS